MTGKIASKVLLCAVSGLLVACGGGGGGGGGGATVAPGNFDREVLDSPTLSAYVNRATSERHFVQNYDGSDTDNEEVLAALNASSGQEALDRIAEIATGSGEEFDPIVLTNDGDGSFSGAFYHRRNAYVDGDTTIKWGIYHTRRFFWDPNSQTPLPENGETLAGFGFLEVNGTADDATEFSHSAFVLTGQPYAKPADATQKIEYVGLNTVGPRDAPVIGDLDGSSDENFAAGEFTMTVNFQTARIEDLDGNSRKTHAVDFAKVEGSNIPFEIEDGTFEGAVEMSGGFFGTEPLAGKVYGSLYGNGAAAVAGTYRDDGTGPGNWQWSGAFAGRQGIPHVPGTGGN